MSVPPTALKVLKLRRLADQALPSASGKHATSKMQKTSLSVSSRMVIDRDKEEGPGPNSYDMKHQPIPPIKIGKQIPPPLARSVSPGRYQRVRTPVLVPIRIGVKQKPGGDLERSPGPSKYDVRAKSPRRSQSLYSFRAHIYRPPKESPGPLDYPVPLDIQEVKIAEQQRSRPLGEWMTPQTKTPGAEFIPPLRQREFCHIFGRPKEEKRPIAALPFLDLRKTAAGFLGSPGMARLDEKTLQQNLALRLNFLAEVRETGQTDIELRKRTAELRHAAGKDAPFIVYTTPDPTEFHFSTAVAVGETRAVAHFRVKMTPSTYALDAIECTEPWAKAFKLPTSFHNAWTLHAGPKILFDQAFESLRSFIIAENIPPKQLAKADINDARGCCTSDLKNELSILQECVQKYEDSLTKSLRYD